MKGFLYLIKSDNCKRPYLGSSLNLNKRLQEHNLGKNKSTKNKGPWYLEHSWVFDTIKAARQAEYKIKKVKIKLSIDTITKLLGY